LRSVSEGARDDAARNASLRILRALMQRFGSEATDDDDPAAHLLVRSRDAQ
jgi:hypothetical protein